MRGKQMMDARRKSNCGGKKFQQLGEKNLFPHSFPTSFSFLVSLSVLFVCGHCYLCVGIVIFVCVCVCARTY